MAPNKNLTLNEMMQSPTIIGRKVIEPYINKTSIHNSWRKIFLFNTKTPLIK